MTTLTRRTALAGLAGGGVLANAPAGAAGLCILAPQAEEGPFYVDPGLVRSDIREGRPGVALTLRLRVVEVGPCTPVPGARVDIWHADASGEYALGGRTFCRGTQRADAEGMVTFRTLWPGWYRGRTPHIHLKVLLEDRHLLTGQMYFPDALSQFIYREVQPYAARREMRDTVNATDGVLAAARGDHADFLAIAEAAEGYVGTLDVGVTRAAVALPRRGLPGPPPGDRPPGPPRDPAGGPPNAPPSGPPGGPNGPPGGRRGPAPGLGADLVPGRG